MIKTGITVDEKFREAVSSGGVTVSNQATPDRLLSAFKSFNEDASYYATNETVVSEVNEGVEPEPASDITISVSVSGVEESDHPLGTLSTGEEINEFPADIVKSEGTEATLTITCDGYETETVNLVFDEDKSVAVQLTSISSTVVLSDAESFEAIVDEMTEGSESSRQITILGSVSNMLDGDTTGTISNVSTTPIYSAEFVSNGILYELCERTDAVSEQKYVEVIDHSKALTVLQSNVPFDNLYLQQHDVISGELPNLTDAVKLPIYIYDEDASSIEDMTEAGSIIMSHDSIGSSATITISLDVNGNTINGVYNAELPQGAEDINGASNVNWVLGQLRNSSGALPIGRSYLYKLNNNSLTYEALTDAEKYMISLFKTLIDGGSDSSSES